jgi:hypothetical protein
MAPSLAVVRNEAHRSVEMIRRLVEERGVVSMIGEVAALAGGQLALPVTRARRRHRTFQFRGTPLPYTLERYNSSYRNERAVEISIGRWFAQGGTDRMLEVGNVLPYYGLRGHTVVDKYERVPGVLNVDIVDYVPEQPFEAVVSLSTLEHVGWDEEPRDPEKVLRAFAAVRKAARPSGRVLVTVPVGHHPVLDSALRHREITFPQESWLVRVNRENEWVEADREEALTRRYGAPFRNANAIYVGSINA